MIKRIIRAFVGVIIGLAALTGVIWALAKTLGNAQYPALYAGKPLEDWRQQLYGGNAAASNAAMVTLSSEVFPKLVDGMFHDTGDSAIRLWLVNALNGLPGVQIAFIEAASRRGDDANALGEFGPAAASTVPDLIKAVKGDDSMVKGGAITALGKIGGQPEAVIPLLIPYLDDDNLDVPAAGALAKFGGLAKAAVPKLLPLLNAKDDDDRDAAREALLRIDPDTAAKAGLKPKKQRQPPAMAQRKTS